MSEFSVSDLIKGAFAFLIGGGLAAVLGWRKPGAEADKIKADADHITWTHMVATIERLEGDIAGIKLSRAERDAELLDVRKQLKACSSREKGLIRRIARLESAMKERRRKA